MAVKKSELYSSLWKGCDELRGGMDASQYKDYVLTLLFVKYISDRSDRTLLEVPEGASWKDITGLRNDKEIGDKINTIIAKLAEANDLRGVIDIADFNDDNKLGHGKEMVDRLTRLVSIFDDLDFGGNTAEGDDLLGDAYEYLMRHFATESGKSKGQFYTPAEVSMILARVVGIGPSTRPDQTVYDPTCGSGALLLKAAHEAPAGMSVYGQEMDNATYALARMNMILHGYETAEIWQGNTLSSPHFKNPDGSLRTFDFAVANPPFSTKAWTSGLDPANDEFHRFDGFGVPPEKNGDYAFLLHLLKSLKSTGKGAIILPHGVLFRGGREADIRRELVKRRLIKGIVGLPPNLFYGTGIPACVIVLDKEGAASRTGVFMIDSSKGFVKEGNKNRLRAQDLHKIVDVFTTETEVDGYSRLVPFDEIADVANNYNLNLPRYIDSSEPEDIQDLDAHLNGGIPERDIDALRSYWEAMPSLRAELFETAGREGYVQLTVPVAEVREAILKHPDFEAFRDTAITHFEQWRQRQTKRLNAIQVGDHPKELIAELAEDLLDTFREVPLIDAYDIYQHLIDYWVEVMQDDIYHVVQGGWLEAARLRELHKIKDKNGKLVWGETYDLMVGKRRFKSDLIPSRILIKSFFSSEQTQLDDLHAELASVEQQIASGLDEHGGEGGLLEDVVEGDADKPKIVAKTVKAWLKENRTNELFAEEAAAITAYGQLLDQQSALKTKIKVGTEKLHVAMVEQYAKLTEDEVKRLVVEHKWMARIEEDVREELNGHSRTLRLRLRELAERYAVTLDALEHEVFASESRTRAHLVAMGISR